MTTSNKNMNTFKRTALPATLENSPTSKKNKQGESKEAHMAVQLFYSRVKWWKTAT